ncbi:hypothetical protein CVT24_008613 [Panaeolus cyanescens]|uniref:DUF4419 domain-containing protein n=1 Tax=Panaeolus cyanescens TaxID=181874 RepID=A0A409VDP9_9AGAR|nr:hypothetical protein CVT24_008613 [Panaeolus cyanescens]
MPISFQVSTNVAEPVRGHWKSLSANGLLEEVWERQSRDVQNKGLLNHTFSTNPSALKNAIPQPRNGFVDTILNAYNAHHNLELKPDDVWIAIVSQFNFYVNAHAEELRSKFVAHEDKKKLVISGDGNRFTANFGELASKMTDLIQENVVDPELQKWLLPDFTTTTFNDTVVCSVLMMSTLKEYFSYGFELRCGLPSVTLLGEKEDWEKLLARIDKFKTFGEEPAAWEKLLRPILSRFVRAFDGNFDRHFWSKVCHIHAHGSGPSYMSGWLTAFCVWNKDGVWIGPNYKPLSARQLTGGWSGLITEGVPLRLDGVSYHRLDTKKIPPAICEVEVSLDDNGEKFECMMVAGHISSTICGVKKDTMAPNPAWFMFITSESK